MDTSVTLGAQVGKPGETDLSIAAQHLQAERLSSFNHVTFITTEAGSQTAYVEEKMMRERRGPPTVPASMVLVPSPRETRVLRSL